MLVLVIYRQYILLLLKVCLLLHFSLFIVDVLILLVNLDALAFVIIECSTFSFDHISLRFLNVISAIAVSDQLVCLSSSLSLCGGLQHWIDAFVILFVTLPFRFYWNF